jgi:glutamate carboxypeptidase
MNASQAQYILAYLREQQSSMEELLIKLVALESPSNDPASQDAVFEVLANNLAQLGFYASRTQGKTSGGFLYARPAKRDKCKKKQLLIGHCDTVWSLNTLDKMPIAKRNGKLTGPGVFDMKAGLVQMLFALRVLKKLQFNLPLTPVLLINSDEEIGSGESQFIIERLARISDRAYVLEPPLGPKGKLKTSRKGIGRFTITVFGKAAHAGLDPESGINAIVELSRLVQQLYAMNDPLRGITVNVGMIQGGVSANVVAPQSSAVIDVRVASHTDGEMITKRILGLKPSSPGVELCIEGSIGRPPMERTPRNRALWKTAQAQAGLLGMQLSEASAGGGSDGNTTSLYTATLDGLGTTGDGAHALHEHIITDELVERTALLSVLLMADEALCEKEEIR